VAIADMASRGASKMSRKAAQMSSSWAAAKSRMVANYRGVGFGPTRTRNYEAGISAATHRVDVEKWSRNWQAKMAE
jgi:hypothetical protein